MHSLECAVSVRNRPWSQREIRFPAGVLERQARACRLWSSSRRNGGEIIASPRNRARVEKRIASIAVRINPEFKSHTVGFVRLAAHGFA